MYWRKILGSFFQFSVRDIYVPVVYEWEQYGECDVRCIVITALTYLKLPLTLQILTIAVLSILLTAPTGAVGIAVSGPRLLRRSETKQETGDKGEVEPILDGSNPQMDSTV